MKTKILSLLIVIFSIITLKTSATVYHVTLDTTWNSEWHYFCGGIGDSVIVRKPINSSVATSWDIPTGGTIFNKDSIIITTVNIGHWFFSSAVTGKDFYIYFSSFPVKPISVNDTAFCAPTFTSLLLDAQNSTPGAYAATYLWNDGSVGRYQSINSIGTTWIRITNACGTRTDTMHVTQKFVNVQLGQDKVICYGTTTMVTSNINANTYLWSNGANTPSITVNTTGNYWLNVIDSIGCTGSDTIHVTALPFNGPQLGPDKAICFSTSTPLSTGNVATSFTWSTGSNAPIIIVNTTGDYWVNTIDSNGCTGTDTIHVTTLPFNGPQLGPDKVICFGSSIVLTTGNNASTYQWSTSATTPTITVSTSGNYIVHTVDSNGCNGFDTINVTVYQPISASICYVDVENNKNGITWGTLPSNSDSIRIYKETTINNWIKIGTVSKTANQFKDLASLPETANNSYKITIIDTCGNESSVSSVHTSMLLTGSYNALGHTYTFNWTGYFGISISSYVLYGIDSANNLTQITTVSGNTFTYSYSNPNTAYIKYIVGFQTQNCLTLANISVRSNELKSLATSVNEITKIEFKVYPNPATEKIIIDIDVQEFKVEILTMFGQVLLSEYNAKTLNVSDYKKGTYIISIQAYGISTNNTFIKN